MIPGDFPVYQQLHLKQIVWIGRILSLINQVKLPLGEKKDKH